MKVLLAISSTLMRTSEKAVSLLRQNAHPVPTHSVSSSISTPTIAQSAAERAAVTQTWVKQRQAVSGSSLSAYTPSLPFPTRRAVPPTARRLFHTTSSSSSSGAHIINNAVNQTESSLTFAGVAAWTIVRKLTTTNFNSNLQTLRSQHQQHTRAYVHSLSQPRSELSKLLTQFQQQRQRQTNEQHSKAKHLKFGGAGSAVALAFGLMATGEEEYQVNSEQNNSDKQLAKAAALNKDIGNDHKLYESPIAHVVDDILCKQLADTVVDSAFTPSFLSQIAAYLITTIKQHKLQQEDARREQLRNERRKKVPQVVMPAWFDCMLKFNGTQLELTERSLPSLLHWYQLSNYLKSKPEVTAVLFKNVNMKPERLQMLVDNKSFVHLQHLTIRSCSLGVYSGNCKRLTDAFGLSDNATASTKLTSLHLDRNSLTAGDLATLNRLLLRSPSLQTLNLSWNNLNDNDGIKMLCRVLRATVGVTELTSINLRHNRIGSNRREIRQLQSELAAVGLQVNVDVY